MLYPSDASKQHYVYLVFKTNEEKTIKNLYQGQVFRSEKKVKDHFKKIGLKRILNTRECFLRLDTDIGLYDVYKINRGDPYEYPEKFEKETITITRLKYKGKETS